MSALDFLKALASTTDTGDRIADRIAATNPEDLFVAAEVFEALNPLARKIVLAIAADQTLEEFLETHDGPRDRAKEVWGSIDHHLARVMPGQVAEYVEDEQDAAALKALERGQTEAASQPGYGIERSRS